MENPIIASEGLNGMIFKDNTVENCGGTQGFMYTTLREAKNKPILIHNNTFTHIAGFHGAAAIHVAAF